MEEKVKISRLLALGAAALLTIAFTGCDLLGQTEEDSGSSGSSASVSSASAGDIAIDVLDTNGINIRVFQDEDGTIVVNNQTVVVDGDANTTTTTTTEVASNDSANLATLYLDVYISPNSGDLFTNDDRLYDTISDDEWDMFGNTLTAAQIKTFLGIDQFSIGETFYWGVRVTNDGAKVLGTLSNSVRVTPPLNNSDTVIAYDFNGWYIQTSYPTYEDMVVDFYYGEDTAISNKIVNIDGFESGATTYYRAYLPATFTVAANTVYYAYPVAKNLKWNVATTGETDRVEAKPSVSEMSQWGFTDGTLELTATAQELAARNFTLSWNDLEPVELDDTEYTLYLDTANPPTTEAAFAITAGAGIYSADVDGLLFGTTYYAYVVAVGSYDDGASVDVATRTWESPIVAFTTPDPMVSELYTFDSGLLIPTAAVTNAPAEIIRANGSIVDNGDPAPAYSMDNTSTIATTMAATANTYTGATFAFDMKTSALQNCWTLLFDDQNHSSAGFNPTTYDLTTPSAQYAAIFGPVVSLQYYADDPTTTAANDPVYAIYAYYLAADNTVDIDIATALDQNDADTNPDVVRVRLATFTTFTSGMPVKYNNYRNVSVTVTTTGATPTVSVSLDGAAAVSQSLVSFGTNSPDSVLVSGLNRMQFSALNNIIVDNVQFTASNGATPYSPSIR